MNKLPTISILIPTLNAAVVLEKCLKAIVVQNYPKDKLEIIIADGGSTDGTLKIAKTYGAKIYPNPLKTGEAGKAAALRYAKGDLVALIDSDNILPQKDWLKKMIEPFFDSEIIGSEPWEFTYRKADGFIDRYCALMGMNDPLCFFLGNFDRKNAITGRWTSLDVDQRDRGDWLVVTLRPPLIPTIGANGTILRRQILVESNLIGKYLFDIDIISQLSLRQTVKFAKVKIGIIHLYSGFDIGKFIRKQDRRIKDYLHYQKIGVRNYPWQKQNKIGLIKFVLSCTTIIPLIWQTIRGWFRKPDSAWFFHPLACWLTLMVYSKGKFISLFTVKEMTREKWRQ